MKKLAKYIAKPGVAAIAATPGLAGNGKPKRVNSDQAKPSPKNSILLSVRILFTSTTEFAKITFYPLFLPEIVNIKTGNNTKLVIVPTTNVNEVNQPNALVPPKSLKLKMMNPAIKTREV